MFCGTVVLDFAVRRGYGRFAAMLLVLGSIAGRGDRFFFSG